MKQEPMISVVLPCHSETHWLIRAARSVFMQIEAPLYELIIVCDRTSSDTTAAVVQAISEAPAGIRVQPITVDFGDLGEARNAGIKAARGRFVSLIDADDIFGCTWLRQAFEFARRFDNDDFVLHHQHSLMFGAANFFHRHFASGDPEFSPRDCIQYNPVSALAFAPRALFERFPYRRMDPPWAWEDWTHYVETLGEGIQHYCVPDSIFMIRMKLNETSLAARMTARKGALGPMKHFDKRNVGEQQHEAVIGYPPQSVMKQILFAHHRVGEYRVQVDPNIEIRTYPRQVIWDDQALLRDQIGDAKHVVLCHELKPGGAEKYAIDVCQALKEQGKDCVLIETAPGASPWLQRAQRVARVIQWHKRRRLQPPEIAYAAQRALIQCELDSLFVVNSELGWALVQENCAVLAKKVIAASFSNFPLPTGFTSMPPIYMDKFCDNLTLLTDNDRHAERLRGFGVPRVEVIHPRVNYDGVSKLRQMRDDRLRILWAGRGSNEKGSHLPPLIAASMPNVDIHIWGDVPPMLHALPNLHYRGAFDGFSKIDGVYDAYLMTSSFEGMPNTAIEAVFAGLPVISSDVGDVRKIAAALFPPPTTPDVQRHVTEACRAVAGFFAEQGRYQHDTIKTIVEDWRDSFAARVSGLLT